MDPYEAEQKCIKDWITAASEPGVNNDRKLTDEKAYVFQPVYLYPLSPLQARAILEIAGMAKNYGCDIKKILESIALLAKDPGYK